MKCPKCHYVSFDPEPRCRNCGYTLDFDPDLVITRDPDAGSTVLADLDLRSDPPAPRQPAASPAPHDAVSDGDVFPAEEIEAAPAPVTPPTRPRRVVRDSPRQIPVTPRAEPKRSQPATPPPAPRARREPPPPTGELPLFVKPVPAGSIDRTPEASDPPAAAEPVEPVRPAAAASPPPVVRAETRPAVAPATAATPGEPTGEEPDDELPLALPIVTPPPLSVRRPAADALRPTEPRAARRDPDLLGGLDDPIRRPPAPESPSAERLEVIGPARRVGAALLDGVLVAAVTGVILRLTLGWVDFSWTDWSRLPLVPLSAFLLLVVAGYLFVFTLASGQTPGKMVAGIRVVDAGAAGVPVTMPQALLRALATLPAVLIAGLGFLPALVGEERGVHDRVAHTRVVRA